MKMRRRLTNAACGKPFLDPNQRIHKSRAENEFDSFL
jgi:hypothetical protein